MRTTGTCFAIMVCGLLAGCQPAGIGLMNVLAPDVERTESTFASGPRGRMDVYATKQSQEPGGSAPLIVFWYGGSWQRGERADYRFVGAALAERGAVVAVPDYRLYPEVRFPDFLRDAAAAVAHAQQEARTRGADPRRTVLGGHSAGAYIAAMLALQPRYLREAGVDPASIAGVFGLSGPYAINPDTPALHDIFTARALPAEYQAVPHATAGAPPALLAHGGEDDLVNPAHTAALATALRAAGVQTEVHIAPGRGHVDTVVALSRPGSFRIPGLLDEISAFALRVPVRAADELTAAVR